MTTSYPREEGDPAGAFVAGFARWLAETGCAVEIVAAGPGGASIDGLSVSRVDGRGLFYRGGAPDALVGGGVWAWGHAARFQAALAARVARRGARWEAAVSHWVVPSGIATALAIGRRRHLAVAHSSDIALLRRSMAGRTALRWLARRADLVYSAAHLVVEGAPGRVVAMGIDDVTGGSRTRGRERFLLRRNTALFLGRLVAVKGVDLLLDALPDELDLIVAGAGPLAGALRERARRFGPRVRFVGEVRGEEKRDLLAAADLLVVPSRVLDDGRTEGTPTVILEGLSAGLPVCATRVGGAETVLRDGETGLLVDPEPRSLRTALERLAGDPALRERLALAARIEGERHRWAVVGPRLAGDLLEPWVRTAVRGA
ncbi:MAG: glycosyltransferase [Myxococcales bacterium]|nr:glycosyltransferase [Myxococcales bacterium]